MPKKSKSLVPITINSVQLWDEILVCLLSRVVPYITSAPGIGKSQITASIAKHLNLKLIDIRLSTAQPEDLHGYPSKVINPDTGIEEATFIPFRTFPTRGTPLPVNPDTGEQYNGWLVLFDELSSASKPLQAAAYKVILDRQIGEHDLHEKVAMVAAGNREEDNSVVFEMSQALRSRMVHFELEPDAKVWVEWAFENDIDSKIITFIRNSNDELCKFDAESAERTFACPRTWEMLSRVLKNSSGNTADLPMHRIGAVIGNGSAGKFLDYCKYYLELPQLETIVNDPKGTPIPSDNPVKYALSDMLGSNKGINPGNIEKVITYIKRLPVDMQANFIFVASRANKALLSSPSSDKCSPFEELTSQVVLSTE